MARLLAYDDRGSQALHLRRAWAGTQLFGGGDLQTQPVFVHGPLRFADACALLEVALDASAALWLGAEAGRGLDLAPDALAPLAVPRAATWAIALRSQPAARIELPASFPDVLLEVMMDAIADLETGEDAAKSVNVPPEAEVVLPQEPDAKADLKVGEAAARELDVEECDKK